MSPYVQVAFLGPSTPPIDSSEDTNTEKGFGPGTRARDLAYEFERYVNQASISR
jgi:S-adenosylmethionine synthetase